MSETISLPGSPKTFPDPLDFPVYEPPSARPVRVVDGVAIREDLHYVGNDGYRPQLMDLYVPVRDEPVPVVVSIHGGAWLGGSHKPRPEDLIDFPALWKGLTDAGVAVASITYRHSLEAPFPACLHDTKAAIRWLRGFAGELGIDPGRIGTWGESAGGHLATLAAQPGTSAIEGAVGLTGPSSDVQAVAAWYPVTTFLDAPPADRDSEEAAAFAPLTLLLGGWPTDVPQAAHDASTVSWIAPDSPPVLVVHGDADSVVPHEESVRFVELYRQAGAEADLVTVREAEHCFLGLDLGPVISRTVDHFRRQFGL